MKFFAPLFIVAFATVVYSKRWRQFGGRECCSCTEPGAPNNDWTVTKRERPRPGGGGGEGGPEGAPGGDGGLEEAAGKGGGGGGHGSGEAGGGGGGQGGYDLRDGVISGAEPNDFQGRFTNAMRKLQRQVLRRHNYWRRKHGVPPLQHNEQMCRYAQAYAYRLAQIGTMRHRSRNKKYGENLFVAWSSGDHRVHGKTVVDSWYDEIKMYKWSNRYQPGTGHFTQVVWKKSRYLGSGIARGRDNKIFVVSNYDPPGNLHGAFRTNVPRPQGGGDD
ncbi:Golgi-associated plant pathogenesis-related protein 1-like [Haemaphysalis longicornis]